MDRHQPKARQAAGGESPEEATCGSVFEVGVGVLGHLNVSVSHLLDQLLQACLARVPAQLGLRLAGVSQQQIHLRSTTRLVNKSISEAISLFLSNKIAF